MLVGCEISVLVWAAISLGQHIVPLLIRKFYWSRDQYAAAQRAGDEMSMKLCSPKVVILLHLFCRIPA